MLDLRTADLSDSDRATLDDQTKRYATGAKRGDAGEFARLYEHVAPAVFAWANLRLRGDHRTVLDPSDLVQEVWMRAWRKIEDLDVDKIPFRFWIFRIAKNVLLEASRQARRPDRSGSRSSQSRAEGEPDPLQQVADSVTAVSRRIAKDEGLARFQEHVSAMDPDDRSLVVHCGLEGLGLREVGERLGISTEAAAKRWQRLRAKLRESELPQYLLAD